MTNWTARANAHFQQERQDGTDKTDKTPISSVLSVGPEGVCAESGHGFAGFVSDPLGRSQKTAIPVDESLRTPPAEIEQRVIRLLLMGAIDSDDAALVRRRYRFYPAEWDLLLDCCERAVSNR